MEDFFIQKLQKITYPLKNTFKHLTDASNIRMVASFTQPISKIKIKKNPVIDPCDKLKTGYFHCFINLFRETPEGLFACRK